MGQLDGKVALVTGAARGQGRSHAVRLAEEGADVIAVDLCAQIPSVPYPLATPEELDETGRQVETLDRRVVTQKADVRDGAALRGAVGEAVAKLGRLDVVVANAGICPIGSVAEEDRDAEFRDVLDVNTVGVWNTAMAAIGHLRAGGRGGSMVLTSSTAGLKGIGGESGDGYVASKHAVVGLMRNLAVRLAPDGIRVNTVHPTGVMTPMIDNDTVREYLQTANPQAVSNLLDVPAVEPADISEAVLFLASDRARYITGTALPVDAGFCAK